MKSKSKSPLATNRSRSSSKSSVNSQGEGKVSNSVVKRDTSEEKKKKVELKSKHSDKEESVDKSITKPKKHKKHKDDHHKHHHHHHHKHHHHKKHKTEKCERTHSSIETVIHSGKSASDKSSSCLTKSTEQEYDSFILENSKSDLTMKIKKSPSPHTNHEEVASVKNKALALEMDSSSSEESSEPPRKKQKKSKVISFFPPLLHYTHFFKKLILFEWGR